MIDFLIVGAGGGLGAMARYGLGLLPVKAVFPVVTLAINFFGAFLIGVVIGIAETRGLSKEAVLFWKTGVCGGFTTFSTFSLEAVMLFEQSYTAAGLLYVAGSVLLCLLGVLAGRSAALWAAA